MTTTWVKPPIMVSQRFCLIFLSAIFLSAILRMTYLPQVAEGISGGFPGRPPRGCSAGQRESGRADLGFLNAKECAKSIGHGRLPARGGSTGGLFSVSLLSQAIAFRRSH